MIEDERQLLERFANTYETARRYQKRFFAGDYSALKLAKYYEKEADALMAVIVKRFGLVITQPKGPASQGTLM